MRYFFIYSFKVTTQQQNYLHKQTNRGNRGENVATVTGHVYKEIINVEWLKLTMAFSMLLIILNQNLYQN